MSFARLLHFPASFSQSPVSPLPPGINLKGKTAIITGSNGGIGYETARHLLALNISNVILAVRSMPNGEEARSTLAADNTVKLQNPHANIKVMYLDMDDYRSVASFAAAVDSDVPALHLLILHAGIAFLKHEYGPSGHEWTIQVNYLSNALLICAWLPLLESKARQTGSPSHITCVSSRLHRQPSMESKKPIQPDSPVLGHLDDQASFFNLIRYGIVNS